MFETAADQADGLRRLFSPREPSVIPMACCAPASACRGYATLLTHRLRRDGMTPVLFDRLDLGHDLGDVEAHAPVDRVVLLEDPLRLARLQQFEIGIQGYSPSDLLMPAARLGRAH